VLFEPNEVEPVVEYVYFQRPYRVELTSCSRSIVFVHGLQGHPQKTWSCKRADPGPARHSSAPGIPRRPTPTSSRPLSPGPSPPKRRKLLNIFPSQRKPSNMCLVDIGLGQDGHNNGTDFVYWPRDLLSIDCPKARIMTWGYDTVITKGIATPTNKSNIFAHAKDLLYALVRERPQGRPLIFVAHSLGGIVVKEVKILYLHKNLSCFRALELSSLLKGRLLTSSRCFAGPKVLMKKVSKTSSSLHELLSF
jgi:hypothetical protein